MKSRSGRRSQRTWFGLPECKEAKFYQRAAQLLHYSEVVPAPDDARGMILGDPRIEGRGSEDDLLTIGGAQPWLAPRRLNGLGRHGWIAGHLEEGGLVELGPFAFRRSAHREIITFDSVYDDQICGDRRFLHRLSA